MREEKPKIRKHDRKPTLVLLDVSNADAPDDTGRAAVVDISIGGCAFESNFKLSEGDRVIMRFTLPGNKLYVMEGEVKRVRFSTGAFVYGIKFMKLGFFGKIKLRKLISIIRKG